MRLSAVVSGGHHSYSSGQRVPGDAMTSTLPHRLPQQRTPRGIDRPAGEQADQHAGGGAATRTTPYLDLDVPTAVRRFEDLAAALPGTAVHYAVKANPHPRLLDELAAAGCRFDVASPVEVRAALDAGATPTDLVYSNPVKRRDHVVESAELGVRLFVVDSLDEVDKVAAAAPGSR